METKGIFGFKLDEVKGKDAYIENALEKELAYLKSFDADRLVAGFREVNKLRPQPHHTHQNLKEALDNAQRIGAGETYFIHMSHHIGLHADERVSSEGTTCLNVAIL